MRIHDAYRTATERPSANPSSRPSSERSLARISVPPQSSSPAAVALSPTAHELASASAKDDARIDALRAAIHNGSFKIDARAIATKLAGGEEDEP